MPRHLHLSVEGDYVQTLTRVQPMTGIAELVWNGLDAEAETVSVSVSETPLGAVDMVEIADDGHGMGSEDVDAFGHLGGSWKRHTRHSRNGKRLIHGHHGRGRLRAFSVGDFVRWISVIDTPSGRFETTISGSVNTVSEAIVDDPVSSGRNVGTRVVIDNVSPAASTALLRDDATDRLTMILAPYFEQYPGVKVMYRGQPIDPTALQAHRASYTLDVPGMDTDDGTVELEVIEWTKDFDREIFLCDGNGLALWSRKPGVRVGTGYTFTAYIRWEGFREHEAELPLADGDMHPVLQPIFEVAQEQLREHFRARDADATDAIIEVWKAEEVYPYEGEPSNEFETLERQVFDVAAVTASWAVNSTGDRRSKKLSLRLLREAVEQSPSALRRVLKEVLDLPDDKLADFDALLTRTTLSALISLGKTVTDRLEFVEALDVLLFSPEGRRNLLERPQLHELLAADPWIFGEEWSLAVSERTLTTMLREHLKLLGRTSFVGEFEAVELADGTTRARCDMMFALAAREATERHRHLVVELKRPSVVLGMDHHTQIVNYADAVVSDPRFNTVDVKWEFWLIGNEIDRPLTGFTSQVSRPRGMSLQGGGDGRYDIWVKTWAQLLHGARHRLKFVRDQLEYQSTDQTVMQHLNQLPSEHVPQEVVDALGAPAVSSSDVPG